MLMAVLLYLYAKRVSPIYSVRATVFPLTTGQDNNSASSKLTELLGGSAGNKSLSEEANVNIEEVGRSKKTRDAVVSARLPRYGNKTVAEVLIKEYNDHRSFLVSPISISKFEQDIIDIGSELLKNASVIKFNKNSLLEISFSSTDKELLVPVDNLIIDKVSQFYSELKREKAAADLQFIESKVDSIERVLNKYDRQRVAISNKTLFVPKAKLEYSIPKENIENDKLRVLGQKAGAASNREEALWRLQKVTPIVKVLDRPGPPFAVLRPSAGLYAAAGFFIGCLLFAFASIANLIYRYINRMVHNAIDDKPTPGNTTITS